jgi:hypothetical protein
MLLDGIECTPLFLDMLAELEEATLTRPQNMLAMLLQSPLDHVLFFNS